MKTRFFFVFIILIITSFESHCQHVEFYKEDLKFSIDNDWFKVRGTYFFRNLTGDTIRKYLIYPFPEERVYGKIDSVTVINRNDFSKTNELRGINSKGAFFVIKILPRGTAVYEISYQQQITSGKMKYIITSMNTWRNNLEVADFELTYPVKVCIGSINFLPDQAEIKNDKVVWKWNKTDFMPKKDIEICLRQ